jgi:hypothetical protein
VLLLLLLLLVLLQRTQGSRRVHCRLSHNTSGSANMTTQGACPPNTTTPDHTTMHAINSRTAQAAGDTTG